MSLKTTTCVIAGALACLTAAVAATESTPGNSVLIRIEARLSPDGSARGSMTASYTGQPADDLRTRIGGLSAQDRAAALSRLVPVALAGHARPDPDAKDEQGRLTVHFALDVPHFAIVSPDRMRLTLPWLAPPDPNAAIQAGPAALIILHDISLVLPAGFAAPDLPAAFSTVTPGAGRYVLYHRFEGPSPGMLKAHRELELNVTQLSRLAELLRTVAEHDAIAITLPRVPQKPRPGS